MCLCKNTQTWYERHEANFFIFLALVFFPPTADPNSARVVCLSRVRSKLGRLERVFIVNEEIQLGLRADDGHPGGAEGGGEGWRCLCSWH